MVLPSGPDLIASAEKQAARGFPAQSRCHLLARCAGNPRAAIGKTASDKA